MQKMRRSVLFRGGGAAVFDRYRNLCPFGGEVSFPASFGRISI
jgi:hypothetical protein